MDEKDQRRVRSSTAEELMEHYLMFFKPSPNAGQMPFHKFTLLDESVRTLTTNSTADVGRKGA